MADCEKCIAFDSFKDQIAKLNEKLNRLDQDVNQQGKELAAMKERDMFMKEELQRMDHEIKRGFDNLAGQWNELYTMTENNGKTITSITSAHLEAEKQKEKDGKVLILVITLATSIITTLLGKLF